MTDKTFDVQEMYNQFLALQKMDESQMHHNERIERKRCFMAGAGSMLIKIRDDVAKLSEAEGVKVLESLFWQISKFWMNEVTNQYNSKN